MHRSIPTYALAVLLAITLATCTPPAAAPVVVEPTAASLTTLRVCTTATTTGVGLEYAARADLFAGYGLAVELQPISSGANAAAALIAGDVDICEVGGPSVVNAALAGEELVIVAGLVNQQFYSLVVRPEIQTVDDLAGKVVASGSAGGSSDTVLAAVLRKLGLEPDVDVTILNVGKGAERLAAMETGQVAATIVLVTEVPSARELGFRVLVNASELEMPHQHTVIATRRSFLENNRQAVVGLVQALTDSIARMKQDRTVAIPMLAESMLMDPEQDAERLNETYDVLVLGFLEEKLYPTREGVQALIDAGREENPNAVALSVDDLIDESIVKELDDSGFIDKLYGR